MSGFCERFIKVASRVGEQLELALDDVRLKLPWGGRSPRALTGGSRRLFLKRKQQSVSDFVGPGQCDLFKKAAPRYSGAPLLLPLGRGDGRNG